MTGEQRRRPVIVIGVGNAMRRDDGIGPAVVACLENRDLGDGAVDLIALDGEPARLIEAWRDRRRAIVIDAADTGGPGGTIRRLEPSRDPLPPRAWKGSSHSSGVAEAMVLGRALELLPDHLVLFGVAAEDLSLGEGLTSAVRAALPDLVEQVTTEALW